MFKFLIFQISIIKHNSFIKLVIFFEYLLIEDYSALCFQSSIVDHIEWSFISEIFGEIVAGRFSRLQQSHMLIKSSSQLRAKIRPILLLLWIFVNSLVERKQFTQRKPIFFVQIYFNEFSYLILEIWRPVLHIKSPPKDSLNVLIPFIANQLIP